MVLPTCLCAFFPLNFHIKCRARTSCAAFFLEISQEKQPLLSEPQLTRTTHSSALSTSIGTSHIYDMPCSPPFLVTWHSIPPPLPPCFLFPHCLGFLPGNLFFSFTYVSECECEWVCMCVRVCFWRCVFVFLCYLVWYLPKRKIFVTNLFAFTIPPWGLHPGTWKK